MTAQLFLTHARLRVPQGTADAASEPAEPPHRALWALFEGDADDGSDTKRDFLWRDEGEGRYALLSPRPSANQPSAGGLQHRR
jgi:CRISPR system Cascade subunit CasE